MLTLEQLINTNDPGWPVVQQWINEGTNKVEVLPVDEDRAKAALLQTQVTTRSPMGAVVFATGGLLIDDGWIRVLGSGHEKLKRTLPQWNVGKSFDSYDQAITRLLIADDAVGGFFMLNGGALGEDVGKVYYFAPDNLEYESLGLTYSQFLFFCFNNNLNEFYQHFRWTGWQEDLAKLHGDQVFNFYPYLWTEEGRDINKISRKAVLIEEQYGLNMEFRKQLGIEK